MRRDCLAVVRFRTKCPRHTLSNSGVPAKQCTSGSNVDRIGRPLPCTEFDLGDLFGYRRMVASRVRFAVARHRSNLR
jgi:hypothetical protein